MDTCRAIILLTISLMAGACVESPDPWKPDGGPADTLLQEVAAADVRAVPETTAAETTAEVVPEVAVPEPTCFEALDCLVQKKEWTVGSPFPEGDCTEGMSEEQTAEMDALLLCVAESCQANYDAWLAASPGGPELGLLYGCLIESCSKTIAVCVGGGGGGDCGDALYCLKDCASPMDQECSLACLGNTTDTQSAKTGSFLECVFKSCTLQEFSMCGMDVFMGCGLFCPEAA
jgi:hypothetical protein